MRAIPESSNGPRSEVTHSEKRKDRDGDGERERGVEKTLMAPHPSSSHPLTPLSNYMPSHITAFRPRSLSLHKRLLQRLHHRTPCSPAFIGIGVRASKASMALSCSG